MPAETNPPSTAALLPVRTVTLFSSGVAYTAREGTVPAGETTVPLTFRTTQISDLLKSLVLLDEGGTVRPAVYPSRDPVGRTLQTFSIDVTQNRSRADLLRSVRGVELRVQTFAGESLEGRILAVEEHVEHPHPEFLREQIMETLTLLTEEGIIAIDLSRIRLLKLLDPHLDRELRGALITLASGSDDARRTITLAFSGAKQRTVRVGYLTEAPLWKVSYRLVLEDAPVPKVEQPLAIVPVPDAPPTPVATPAFAPHLRGHTGNTPPIIPPIATPPSSPDVPASPSPTESGYLQGWAIVENTSDEDWEAIQLSLVSGRPSSFFQDLYQPLYVPRPIVAPDTQASPLPQTHGGDLLDVVAASSVPAPAGGPMYAPPSPAAPAQIMHKRSAFRAEEASKVSAQATGQVTGELFAYEIDTPISLPRQQAAMIPIVSRGDIPAEKLSLYNPQTSDRRFPWNAVRLTNNTDLHLKAGPITLFDGGTYAGEARMEDIPPGDSRLLTYAIDLQVECERQDPTRRTTEATSLSIKSGVLYLTRSRQNTTVYTVKSKTAQNRRVLIEHPFDADWTVTEPVPVERSAQFYRFAVSLSPGETRTLSIREEQPLFQELALLDSTLSAISYFVTAGTIPVRIKNALRPVVEARRRIEEIDAAISSRMETIASLHDEQSRLRDNLGAIGKDTPLYRRYIAELESQENRLQTLNEEITAQKADRESETARLREYISHLAVE